MRGKPFAKHGNRLFSWIASAALLATAGSASPLWAQTGAAAAPQDNSTMAQAGPAGAGTPAVVDTDVQQAGCSTCGGGLFGGASGLGCSGCVSGCYPGRFKDCCCGGEGFVGRTLCGLYECICCPDPCYEPHYVAAADASFFVDGARPVTQMRFRWDSQFDIPNVDRAEYIWARERINGGGNQLEQPTTSPCFKHGFGKGPQCIPSEIDIEELSLYMEAAAGRFSFFVETPYREIGPTDSVANAAVGNPPCCNVSGFGDMNLGTKSMLLDCELAQITFQFKTFLPTGDFTKGLGTAHVSLEPALLYTLKLAPETYLQAETAYWISVGGDALYQGNIFHAHVSFNHVLWHILPDVLLIGTAEINEWSVEGGNYTASNIFLPANTLPGQTVNKAFAVSGTSDMVSVGPGARVAICDKIDFGVGSAFSLTGPRWAQEQVRAEFRWRF